VKRIAKGALNVVDVMDSKPRQTGVRAAMASAPAPRAPHDAYTERLAYFSGLRAHYNRRRYLWANVSAGAFILGASALIVWAFVRGWAPLIGGVAALVVCAGAFIRQASLDEIFRRYATLCLLCEQGLARLHRDWAALTLRPAETDALPAINAADLDMLGHASLQHLLNTVTTPLGQERLLRWLVTPAKPEIIGARQAAVRELASRLELRDELTLFGALADQTPGAQARFLAWAEDAPWLPARRWLSIYSIVAVIALAALAMAQATGILPYPFWLVVVAANVVVMQISGREVERQIGRVAGEQGAYLPYVGLFGFLSRQRFNAPLLERARDALAAESDSAEAALRSLAHRMQFADVRLSIIGPVLQLGLLWNVHALGMLERWRERHGRHARSWFDLLADLEALSGLAALAFDNPDWAFPTLEPVASGALSASGLGHPLLPPEACVGNDVTVGPGGTFLLVTGSNMSGKSTLLRAIGLNVTLAQAGAPVCAQAMRLPPIGLATSMRVQDSLEQGVSYFMAELRRLKLVVDEMRRIAAEGERLPLFLLDEILSGTNSGERRIAARSVIYSLLALSATGAVSTHDLSLIDEPGLRAASVPVHFTERFTRGPDGPSMSFDYRLRPGVATSVNALALMEIAGLPTEYAADGTEAPSDATKPVIH
jgi:MutS-like protein